jgi:hypothetical protein
MDRSIIQTAMTGNLTGNLAVGPAANALAAAIEEFVESGDYVRTEPVTGNMIEVLADEHRAVIRVTEPGSPSSIALVADYDMGASYVEVMNGGVTSRLKFNMSGGDAVMVSAGTVTTDADIALGNIAPLTGDSVTDTFTFTYGYPTLVSGPNISMVQPIDIDCAVLRSTVTGVVSNVATIEVKFATPPPTGTFHVSFWVR